MGDYLSDAENQAMFEDETYGDDKPGPEQSEKDRNALKRVQSWWAYAKAIQSGARTECMRDHDVYDGDSWLEDDKAEVEARGQMAINFNRIKPTLDWLIGTEKKNRIDFRVLPRTGDDAKGAETKTQILKYLSDVNKLPVERSQAFRDCVISGLGWMEVGKGDDPGEEPIFIDYEDWRNLWFDPLSVRLDLKDARFVVRRKRVDLDVACAMFPDKAGALKMAAKSNDNNYGDDQYYDEDTDLESNIEALGVETDLGGLHHSSRSRVELIECWYKTPQTVQILDHGTEDIGTLRGSRYYEDEETHLEMVEGGFASVTNAIRMVMRCMIFSDNVVLQDNESPYNHNRFPFIPIWGFRKKKDNTQYGAVRNLRDMQDDLNKRRSKALFILSTNQVVADEDAADDWDEVMDEVSRPDGLIRKKKGSEFEINNERSLAREHVDMMMQDAEYIESVGGVTDEQMGRETNAVSGKAIEARKEQGNIVNSELFDNLRVSTQLMGEIILSLVEQYYTDQKIVRITSDKNQPEFVEINAEDPETGEMLNDITASTADFVVDSAAWSASVRQAAFETLMEMITKMPPEIALNLLDLVVDLSDLPGKDDLVARIRMVNGMSDPDADPNDPEQQAAQQAKQQKEEAQAALEEMMQQLEMKKTESEIGKNQADSEATRAGMRYDEEKLKIEKAKALHSIQTDNKAMENPEAKKTGSSTKAKPAAKTKNRTQETKKGIRGIKSDNQEKGA